MVDFLLRWKIALMPLIGILLILFLTAHDSDASVLNDIRIGQYDGYTRVVFEFDTSIRKDTVIASRENSITAVFKNASNSAKSKIPYSTTTIDHFEIKQSGANLTASLIFNFSALTIDAFYMSSPYRLVMDVFRAVNVEEINAPFPIGEDKTTPIHSDPPISESSTAVNIKLASLEPSSSRPVSENKMDADQNREKPLTKIKDHNVNKKEAVHKGNEKILHWMNHFPEMALTATTIAIIALLSAFFFEKKQETKQHRPKELTFIPKDKNKEIQSIDQLINEKLDTYNSL